jgi:sulfopyruvate decarboxylase TPP-binding subunit
MDQKLEEPAAEAAEQLSGSAIISAIKDASIDFVLAVPDLHTSLGLLMPIAEDPELPLIRTCKEDECLGISAGLSYGDKRALILIQYTGFLYAMNAIRAMAAEQQKPICLMVGLLGKPPGVLPKDAKRVGVRAVEPLLDVLGISHQLIETDADVPLIAPAINDAYENSHPTAFLIGQRPVAP